MVRENDWAGNGVVTDPLRLPLSGENFGLASQVRRAALSIPANIAEGAGRSSDRDFAKFLQIAIASATELEYHLEFAVDAGLIARAEFVARQRDIVEVRRMLVGLTRRLRTDKP